jgi:3-oxoadipate enol-lactonase
MPYAITKDNVKLYYEEAGSGTPILFFHEFAGDYRDWEPQMRFLSRRHRVITYSARGYQPSDIPADVKSYSYMHWVNDAVAILDLLKIAKTHFVGLSMGGFTAVMLGVDAPDRFLSLTAAGAGAGSERGKLEEFRKNVAATAEQFEQYGSEHVVKNFGMAAARIPFLVKNPRGFAEFNEHFASHDPKGSANTLRGSWWGGRRSTIARPTSARSTCRP